MAVKVNRVIKPKVTADVVPWNELNKIDTDHFLHDQAVSAQNHVNALISIRLNKRTSMEQEQIRYWATIAAAAELFRARNLPHVFMARKSSNEVIPGKTA